MTREEEIKKAARRLKKVQEIGMFNVQTANQCLKDAELQEAFINGAKWADEHPINYDGKAMLYVNQKSHDNGYKEAVEKACDWLEKNVADIWNSPCNPDKIVEDFRKAMKGEKQ